MNPSSEFERKSLEGIRRKGGGEGRERDMTRMLKKFAPERSETREIPAPLPTEEPPPPISPKEEILITEVVDVSKREGMREREPLLRLPHAKRLRTILWGVASGVAIILVSAVIASTAFSRLTVTVKPRVEEFVLEDIAVSFDTAFSGVDHAKQAVPAERLELTRHAEGEFAATGRAEIAEKARGLARIYNRYSSAPQTLVATTRFLTKDGVLYRLPKAAQVPGAKIEDGKIVPQFVEAELIADQAGEQANISGEVTLSIPGFQGTPRYEGFYALAPAGFAGGFKGEAEVVARADLTAAEERLTKRVFDELREEIARKTPPGFVLVEGLREIRITKLEAPAERSRHLRFRVSAEGEARVLIFREGDLLSLLGELLLKGDETRTFAGGLREVAYQVRRAELEKGRASVLVRGRARVKALVPDAELRRLLAGGREASIIESLQRRTDLASFRLSFFPPWRSTAPANPDKIRVVIEDP